MRRPGGRNAALAAAVFGAGCADGGRSLSPDCTEPVIEALGVAPLPHNVLGAVVHARVRGADSVALRFGLAGATRDSAAPALLLSGDTASVPVLGLLPEASYDVEPVVYYRCGTATGPLLAFTTGTLPPDLPRYSAGGADPSEGYVVLASGAYGLVIDNTGRVVWYRRFPNGPGLNFQAQPNGRYVVLPPAQAPASFVSPWFELDPLGQVTRMLGCARNLQPRFHDLMVEPDGSWWVMCDDVRTVDLSASGGSAEARVIGTAIHRLRAGGELLFEWTPFDHFDLADLDPDALAVPTINWTHGNALDRAPDGDLLVSFRNLSEITAIDVATGQVRWRMGGARNQFAFEDSPLPPFARQHGVRGIGPGTLVLLDNLGDPVRSQARRFQYDAAGRSARQVSAYGPAAPVVAQLGGTTQPLPGNRTLVSFGNGGAVEEYDEGGNVLWRLEGNPGYLFRAQRIRSLYRPGVGSPR